MKGRNRRMKIGRVFLLLLMMTVIAATFWVWSERSRSIAYVFPERLPDAAVSASTLAQPSNAMRDQWADLADQCTLEEMESFFADSDGQQWLDEYEASGTAPRELERLAFLGNPEARIFLMLGRHHFDPSVSSTGPEYLRELEALAEGGNSTAQLEMGHAYMNSRFGLLEDYAAAEIWFLRALDHGDPMAAYNLAQLYYYGARHDRFPGREPDLQRITDLSLYAGAHCYYPAVYWAAAFADNPSTYPYRPEFAARVFAMISEDPQRNTPSQEAERLAREQGPDIDAGHQDQGE